MGALDWQLSLGFVCALLLSAAAMKGASWRLSRPPSGSRLSFWVSPLFSTESLRRCERATPQRRVELAQKLLAPSGILLISYLVLDALGGDVPRWLLPYLALPAIPALGELVGTLCQLVWSVTGDLLPPHHRRPWRSTSLSDFWGKRWNGWLSDWFRQVTFRPLQARPWLASLVTFLYSGLWHELLIDLPFYLLTGRALFGTLLSFFLLQWAGLLSERALPPRVRRAWFFLVVALPSPLFINEALLRMIHLWPN